MNMSQLQWLNIAVMPDTITKKRFGEIMHDEFATEAEKKAALKKMEEAGGYENLPD